MRVQPGRIRHTVSFTLRHPAGSDAERDFLDAAVEEFLELDYAALGDTLPA